MKKLLFTLLMIVSITSFGQIYKCGAEFTPEAFTKVDGEINISDTTVKMTFRKDSLSYTVIKKVNGLIYITDGVMTHIIIIKGDSGKKKGFEYTNVIYMQMDKKQSDVTMAFYCKAQ